jgi:hypothetical protein
MKLRGAAPLLVAAAAVGCTATMPPVTMKVVDERDGRPIEGVVALFWGSAHAGTITGHGGKSAILFAAETVSDASGTVRFPAQDFPTQPFFLNTNYDGPTMLLLERGYAPVSLFNENHIVPTLAQASAWNDDGRTIAMKQASDAELRQAAYWVTLDTNAVMQVPCGWKKVPRTLVTADRMFPDPGMTNTLRGLFLNDALYAQQGCGSPKAFFEPYLRQ